MLMKPLAWPALEEQVSEVQQYHKNQPWHTNLVFHVRSIAGKMESSMKCTKMS
jgi:hypothetical protein